MNINRLNTVLFEDFEDFFYCLLYLDQDIKSKKDQYFYEYELNSHPFGWLLTIEIYSKKTMKPINYNGKNNN